METKWNVDQILWNSRESDFNIMCSGTTIGIIHYESSMIKPDEWDGVVKDYKFRLVHVKGKINPIVFSKNYEITERGVKVGNIYLDKEKKFIHSSKWIHLNRLGHEYKVPVTAEKEMTSFTIYDNESAVSCVHITRTSYDTGLMRFDITSEDELSAYIAILVICYLFGSSVWSELMGYSANVVNAIPNYTARFASESSV